MNPTKKELEDAIKRSIIVSLVNGLIRGNPDELVNSLNRVFQRKSKVFSNLAAWAEKQVQRGHDPEKVVNSLSFYAKVLLEYSEKNLNQPLKK